MGQFHDEFPNDRKIIDWVQHQPLFHVATAPLNGGRINVSPKGFPCFKLVNRRACWYLDLAGQGNETISHLYEAGNGRITLLFEAFDGPPRIVRIFGRGRVFERGTPEFDSFFLGKPCVQAHDEFDFPTPELMDGARSVIWIDITKVGISCGYTVPYMTYEGDRHLHKKMSARLERLDTTTDDPYSVKGLKSYIRAWNTWSVDGLPGVKVDAEKVSEEETKKMMVKQGLPPPEVPKTKNCIIIMSVLIGMIMGRLLTIFVHWSSVHMFSDLFSIITVF